VQRNLIGRNVEIQWRGEVEDSGGTVNANGSMLRTVGGCAPSRPTCLSENTLGVGLPTVSGLKNAAETLR
jgi:hypothetical protein